MRHGHTSRPRHPSTEAKWTEVPVAGDAVNLDIVRNGVGKSRIASSTIICRTANSFPIAERSEYAAGPLVVPPQVDYISKKMGEADDHGTFQGVTKLYGNPNMWVQIFKANRALIDKRRSSPTELRS
jgi:hypothetical protein